MNLAIVARTHARTHAREPVHLAGLPLAKLRSGCDTWPPPRSSSFLHSPNRQPRPAHSFLVLRHFLPPLISSATLPRPRPPLLTFIFLCVAEALSDPSARREGGREGGCVVPGYPPCGCVRACVRRYVRASASARFLMHSSPPSPARCRFYSSSEPAQCPRCIVGREGCSAGRARPRLKLMDGKQGRESV